MSSAKKKARTMLRLHLHPDAAAAAAAAADGAAVEEELLTLTVTLYRLAYQHLISGAVAGGRFLDRVFVRSKVALGYLRVHFSEVVHYKDVTCSVKYGAKSLIPLNVYLERRFVNKPVA